MKKRVWPYLSGALSMALASWVVPCPTAEAAAAPMSTKSIVLNHQPLSTPQGFVADGTTYMPMWYLIQALTDLGFHSTWNGRDLNLIPPASAKVSGGVGNAGSGSVLIQISGTTAESCRGIARPDPASGVDTMYVPIWYLAQVLQRVGMTSAWDGTYWLLDSGNLPVLSDSSTGPNGALVNPNQIYTYDDMVRDIQRLVKAYPDLIQARVVGQTPYGRDIYAVGIGKGKATVFINGSHHAREWITTNLTMYMIDQYAHAYQVNGQIGGYDVVSTLNNATLWFIPMVNPDGVTLVQEGSNVFPASVRNALITMNNSSSDFSQWKSNAQGIDLNHQYDGGWANIHLDVVNHPWMDGYKGTRPYQASEVQAVLKLIAETNPQMEVSYHSSGEAIYFGYEMPGWLYSMDATDAKKISGLTGYSLQYPSANPSGGGLTDWWTHNEGRPGFTLEVGPFCGSQPVPVQDFQQIWRDNEAVGLYLAQEGYQLYLQHPSSTVQTP